MPEFEAIKRAIRQRHLDQLRDFDIVADPYETPQLVLVSTMTLLSGQKPARPKWHMEKLTVSLRLSKLYIVMRNARHHLDLGVYGGLIGYI